VARGDALAGSDIDLLVDMDLDGKDALWELSGLTEELRELVGVRVDVVCEKLLRQEIADFVKRDLVEL
jgi:predicted nucleotidyltransferase